MQFIGGEPKRAEACDGGDVLELFDTHTRRLPPTVSRVQGKEPTTTHVITDDPLDHRRRTRRLRPLGAKVTSTKDTLDITARILEVTGARSTASRTASTGSGAT